MRLIETNGKWYTDQGEELLHVPRRRKSEHLIDKGGVVVAKRCSPCGGMLPISSFAEDKRGFVGKRGFCRGCDRQRQINNVQGLDIYGNPKKKTPKKVERFYDNDGIVVRKVCAACGEMKSRGEFHISSVRCDGMESYCKPCKIKRSISHVKANPEQYKTYNHNRRAKEAALQGDLSPEEWAESLAYFDEGCALTGGEETTLEHALPIAIGHGGTVAWNCYPLDSSLNSSKSASNLFEWAKGRIDLDKPRFNRLIAFLADKCGLTVDEYRAFYYWCFANPRLTVEEIEADGDCDSLTLWRRSLAKNT